MINDVDAMRSVKLEAIEKYVIQHGWAKGNAFGKLGGLWVFTSGDELMLPTKSGLIDHPLRMSNAIHALSIVEERSQLAILYEIMECI